MIVKTVYADHIKMSDQLFDEIIEHFSHNSDNIHKVLDIFNASKYEFYKVLDSDQRNSERYAQARTLYVENRLAERDRLNQELLDKIQTCDPKLANALQNAYKEQIRQIEWDVQKLLPKKYGDKIDITSNGLSVTREISISLPGKLSDGAKVSTYPESTETNNNDNLSSV